MTGRQKAAIIVRLLLAQGSDLPLRGLPDHMQAALTEQIGTMRSVDRVTLRNVVDEFLASLDAVGLSFPGGIEGALHMLDGHISTSAASRLRRLAGASSKADPWDRIAALDPIRLMPVLEDESIEVGAVMLSKLAVTRAAELLGRLPGDRARRIAYAVSQTSNIDPETVRQIGLALVTQLEALPIRAFETNPEERVGAILNFSPAATRDNVLQGLDETDARFAKEVRKAIFTFTDIHKRIETRDIAKVIRGVDQSVLVTALAGAKGKDIPTVEFILSNMSQRMAGTLRDEMSELGNVSEKDSEAAAAEIVAAIRGFEAAGELVLRVTSEDEGDG
ncbi:MAG: flagellar motor switch protein FliG [Paracoccaceae bacterium]|nr:flagellar motor switch protein FliG [Paracoccaceae bacterium]